MQTAIANLSVTIGTHSAGNGGIHVLLVVSVWQKTLSSWDIANIEAVRLLSVVRV